MCCMMICMTAWEREKSVESQNMWWDSGNETLCSLWSHIFSLNASVPCIKDPNGACLSLMTQEPAVSITINWNKSINLAHNKTAYRSKFCTVSWVLKEILSV